MNTHADKSQENKSQAVANSLPKLQSESESTFQFVDNRPEAIAQRKLQEAINNSPRVQPLKAYQEMANNSPQVKQLRASQLMADNFTSKPVQKEENNTGLPDNLKTGIENLSGYSMDDVKVHYNSDKPAQLQAHAYAQSTDIHLASGQEKHLPHEAWHVVQQKQGRVQPTVQMKGGFNVNDDVGLEKEADVMGSKFSGSLNEGNIQAFKKGQVADTIQGAFKSEVKPLKTYGSRTAGSTTVILASPDLLAQTKTALRSAKAKDGGALNDNEFRLYEIKQSDGSISLTHNSGTQALAGTPDLWLIAHGYVGEKGFISDLASDGATVINEFDSSKLLNTIGSFNPDKLFVFSCYQGNYLTSHIDDVNKGRTDTGIVSKAYAFNAKQNASALGAMLNGYFFTRGTSFDVSREVNTDGEYDRYSSRAKK